MYTGKRVRLREHRVDSAEQLIRWLNDEDTARMLNGGASMPMTLESEREWLLSNGGRQRDCNHFAVDTLEGEYIGGCSYFDWDARNRTCKVGWFIGDREKRGQGYGTDMIETLLRLCFTELNVNKVSLDVFGYNEPAIRLYEQLGFVREGTFREQVFTRNRYWDEYRYSMLRREWDARQTD